MIEQTFEPEIVAPASVPPVMDGEVIIGVPSVGEPTHDPPAVMVGAEMSGIVIESKPGPVQEPPPVIVGPVIVGVVIEGDPSHEPPPVIIGCPMVGEPSHDPPSVIVGAVMSGEVMSGEVMVLLVRV